MAGQYLGAGQPKKAVQGVMAALAVGGGQLLLGGVLFFTCAQPLATFFTGDSASPVVALAAPLLRVAALAMPFLALTIILSGALRGAGDTRVPFLFTLIGFLLVRIPFGSWLALDQFTIPVLGTVVTGLSMGVVGAWYAMVGDLAVRALLITLRFVQGKWKEIEV